MDKLILYGAGGHASAIVELIRSIGTHTVEKIFDTHPKVNSILGISVESPSEITNISLPMGISIGDNSNRKKIANQFPNASFPTFVHASVVQYPSVNLGKGTAVLPGTILDASVTIGDFCIVNNNATVSHHVTIGNYAHIAINVALCGGVSIGEGTLVGAGSIILPEIKIGKWCVIGAGSVVTRDVPDGTMVFGNPAKFVKELPMYEG